MNYRFFGQTATPNVTELDEGWEVLPDPRWPAGLYRQRTTNQNASSSPGSPKPAPKRHPLGAFINPFPVKGMSVDLMV
jgi:hypothetical protein